MENEIRAALERNEIHGSSDRNFGFVMAGFFAILSSVPVWKRAELPSPYWGAISLLFLFFTLVAPSKLHKLNIAWTKLGLLLQKVMSPLILGIIFFGVVFPIGILMRISRYDPLNRKFDKAAKTYWIHRKSNSESSSSMKDQF